MMLAGEDDLQQQAWRAVRRAYSRVVRHLDEDLSQSTGLSLRGYEVLLLLTRAPGRASRMSDLAASLLMSPSGITRLVDQLEGRGLVERRQDRSDARAHIAALTPAGRALFRKATGVYRRSVMNHFCQRLTEDQLVAIAGALEEFVSDAPGPSRARSNQLRRLRGTR